MRIHQAPKSSINQSNSVQEQHNGAAPSLKSQENLGAETLRAAKDVRTQIDNFREGGFGGLTEMTETLSASAALERLSNASSPTGTSAFSLFVNETLGAREKDRNHTYRGDATGPLSFIMGAIADAHTVVPSDKPYENENLVARFLTHDSSNISTSHPARLLEQIEAAVNPQTNVTDVLVAATPILHSGDWETLDRLNSLVFLLAKPGDTPAIHAMMSKISKVAKETDQGIYKDMVPGRTIPGSPSGRTFPSNRIRFATVPTNIPASVKQGMVPFLTKSAVRDAIAGQTLKPSQIFEKMELFLECDAPRLSRDSELSLSQQWYEDSPKYFEAQSDEFNAKSEHYDTRVEAVTGLADTTGLSGAEIQGVQEFAKALPAEVVVEGCPGRVGGDVYGYHQRDVADSTQKARDSVASLSAEV